MPNDSTAGSRRATIEEVRIRVQLLGEFAIEVDGRSVDVEAIPRRSRQLAALLATRPGRHCGRDEVIDALFGHLDAHAGSANLHKAASLLRRHLGDPRSVVLAGGDVWLWPDETVTVDVAEFEQRAVDALTSTDPEQCRRAATAYDSTLLPRERYDAWAEPHRQRVHDLAVELLRVAGAWDRVAELEPADEHAHRALMRRAAGDRGAVHRQFGHLERALAELGLRPSAETKRLLRELTDGPPPTAPLDTTTPLAGRQIELARARALLRAASGGHGGGLLVRGEAGIGKTRLGEALLAEAAELGWATLRGAAARTESSIPYAPVVEALARALEQRPDLSERMPSACRDVLGRLTALDRPADRGQVISEQQIVSTVARFVASLGKDGGVAFLIDDLHAADADTIALVHYLVRAATFQPVVIVATLRPGVADDPAELARNELLANRRATEIALGPLTRDDAAALVAELSPTGSSARVDELWRRAGGNPFLLRELVEGRSDAVAVSIGTAVAALDPTVRHAIGVAAVMGERVTTSELGRFVGADEAIIGRLLGAAGVTSILVDDGPGGHRFRHELVREAVLASMSSDEVTAAHAAIADVLMASDAPAARVAHHLLAGGRRDLAVDHLRSAAEEAMAVGAYRTARAFADDAAALAPRDPAILALVADIAFATGDPATPRRYAEALQASPDPAKGPLRVRQARAQVARGDAAAAAAALTEADVDRPGDVALRQLIAAQIAWMNGDVATCAQLVEECRAMALAHGAMDVVFGAMSLRDLVLHQQGRFREDYRGDLLAAGDSPILAGIVHDAHLCGAETYLYGGRPYAEVKAFAAELTATAAAAGATRGEAFAVTLLGEAELLSGDLAGAEHHLRRGIELHAAMHANGGEALARQRLAQVRLVTGHREAALTLLGDALPLAHSQPAVGWHIVSRVYGTMIEASATTDEAVELVEAGDLGTRRGMAAVCPPCSIEFLLPAAVACAEAGDPQRARSFLAQAEPWIASLGARGGRHAALHRALAHVALAEGDLQAARRHLATAVERFIAVGQPLDALRAAATLDELS